MQLIEKLDQNGCFFSLFTYLLCIKQEKKRSDRLPDHRKARKEEKKKRCKTHFLTKKEKKRNVIIRYVYLWLKFLLLMLFDSLVIHIDLFHQLVHVMILHLYVGLLVVNYVEELQHQDHQPF